MSPMAHYNQAFDRKVRKNACQVETKGGSIVSTALGLGGREESIDATRTHEQRWPRSHESTSFAELCWRHF